MAILRHNRNCEFGRRHRFSEIRTPADFQRNVPLATYEDYRKDIARMQSGEASILTSDPPFLLHPTSGSTSASKRIPFNRTLRREFQAGIHAWLGGLYLQCPGLLWGKSYWSITPALGPHEPAGEDTVPLRFEQDGDYFGPLVGRLLQGIFAVPSAAGRIRDVDSFRYVTLLFLLRERDLRLISVWNPMFLTLLMGALHGHMPAIIRDIAEGTLSPPSELDPEVRQDIAPRLYPDPHRARELGEIRTCGGDNPAQRLRKIWPRLQMISCWTHAHAARPAAILRQLFPGTAIQPKGLLATEAFISLPMNGQTIDDDGGCGLAVNSHFLEFIDMERPTACPCLADELSPGKRYSVVVTTGGGLYRYQLRDMVDVVGFQRGLARVRFVGREDGVSDRCGEKLNPVHVEQVLSTLASGHAIAPDFLMLAPEEQGDSIAYVLFAMPTSEGMPLAAPLLADLDANLSTNPQYAYCRRLGQLGPPRLFLLAAGRESPAHLYLQERGRRGAPMGGIKPPSLACDGGWSQIFHGAFDDGQPSFNEEREP